jgi:GTP-binding protein
MKILSAEYCTSYKSIRDFNLEEKPSVAFIGRSNVGKSSLINHLLNRKKLVKTSSNPGKTQLLNYFLINENCYFIDLPGYGFANVPQKIKKSWQEMIDTFIWQAPQLVLVVQLVDLRHKPSREDIKFQKLLKACSISNLVIANKADKLKKNQLIKSLKIVSEALLLEQKPLLHSALKKTGRSEILTAIQKQLDNYAGL